MAYVNVPTGALAGLLVLNNAITVRDEAHDYAVTGPASQVKFLLRRTTLTQDSDKYT